jgi:molybdenum cofactor cytidylyltransferase
MASGFSTRFGGRNKLLIPFRGKPLARHTLDLVLGMEFAGVFFVAAGDETAALASEGPERLRVIRNRHPERGQRESIRLGVAAAAGAGARDAEGEDWYLFFPCDQPFLDRGTVGLIVEARRPGCIVQPCAGGRPGNPCLFSGAFRDELLTLRRGEHGRDLIGRHPERLIRVEVAASPLTDIDDPETLALFNVPVHERRRL